jgi:large subunit ribosomal protein L1
METISVIQELKKEKKRKFVQSVDLIVNLKNFDVRKEALNTFITLPHAGEKKIAAFLTKKSGVVPTITEADFSKYNEAKDMKKLAREYDYFIAVAPMMSKVASKFGRVFGPIGKMPSPQAGIVPKDDDETVKKMFEKMQSVVRIRNKEMSIKLSVGKESMDEKHLDENIQSALQQLEAKLPRGIDCIKNVLLKFTMTKAVKLDGQIRK